MAPVTKINFIVPPSPSYGAGLKNAVEGLAQSLQDIGIEISFGMEHDGSIDLHHFHGLWHRQHSKFSHELSVRGVPFVVSPHGMLEPWAIKNKWWKKKPYLLAIEKQHLKRAASLFAASTMEADSISKVLSQKHCPIIPIGCLDPRGIDYVSARRKLGWEGEEFVILFLSRLDKKKGLELLFDALDQIALNCAIRLVIVGDGDSGYVSKLKALSLTLNQPKLRIEWVGGVWGESRWKYFQASDLFCLPTFSENFGIAVLESFYAGTPVLTTDQTPWKEHKELPGLTISEANSASLAAELSKALGHCSNWRIQDRQQLHNWAFDTFAWENLGDKYFAEYIKIAQRFHVA